MNDRYRKYRTPPISTNVVPIHRNPFGTNALPFPPPPTFRAPVGEPLAFGRPGIHKTIGHGPNAHEHVQEEKDIHHGTSEKWKTDPQKKDQPGQGEGKGMRRVCEGVEQKLVA